MGVEKIFSFGSWDSDHPSDRHPGERIDAQFDAHANAIRALEQRLDAIVRADGKLHADILPFALPGRAAAPRTSPLLTEPPNAVTLTDAASENWADVSMNWAEHMPDTIPGNILATNAISGDHWSSRWWANRAGEIVTAYAASGTAAVVKLRRLTFDGVQTTFPLLVDATGVPIMPATNVSLLSIIVDGVSQEPGIDFVLANAGTAVTFTTPPSADARNFAVYFLQGDTAFIIDPSKVGEFNVRNYGAVGDGVADDTAAFQACAAAAMAASAHWYKHATITIPRGQYRLTDTPFSFTGTVVPNIVGEGMFTTMLMIDLSFPSNHDVIYIQQTYVNALTTLYGGSASAAAFAWLVVRGSANIADGETVTIDTKVYTFQTTLTNVNGNVKIGVDKAASLLNLSKAIGLTGVAGTDYAAAMTLHPTVAVSTINTVPVVDGISLKVEAKTVGAAGNSIVVADAIANGQWGTQGYYAGLKIADFAVIPVSGNPARHGINFDQYSFTCSLIEISRLYITGLGATGVGRSIRSYATTQGGGTNYVTIRNCWLECVEFVNAGDGINIRDNTFGCYRDGNWAISFNNIGGAHGFHIDSNVIAAISGAIMCTGGTAPRITDNEIEAIPGGSGTHQNNAIINLYPPVGIIHPVVSGNSISSLPGNADQVCVFLGGAGVENCEINQNRMSMATATKPIVIATTATDTMIGWNHFVAASFAYATLTLTAAPANGETVTIDGRVYTWQSALTNVAGNVLINASRQLSLNNLRSAINLTGTPGTDYAAATTLHPTVTAVSTSSTSLLVQAKAYGTAGNALAVSETMTAGAWATGPAFVGGIASGAGGGVSRIFNPAVNQINLRTHFARTVGGSRQVTSADVTLNPDDRIVIATPTAPRTVYLPFGNSVPIGTEIEIYCSVVVTNTLTVALQGADSFVDGTVTRLLNTNYTGAKCVNNGSGIWYYTGVSVTALLAEAEALPMQ